MAAAAFYLYAPALHGGWLWDDREDLPDNPVLKAAHPLRLIWTGQSTWDYYPIKNTLQWLQWKLWGDHTLGYHVTNVVLLVLSALLIWRLLRRLGLRDGWAWCGAWLFLVHPVAVGSVAWITELKDALSLPLLLLAADSYLDFEGKSVPRLRGEGGFWDRSARGVAVAAKPGAEDASGVGVAQAGGKATGGAGVEAAARRLPPTESGGPPLLRSWAWFVLAVLAKSSVVMFPVCLLLYGWWARRPFRRILLSSLPFFAVSAIFGAVAVVLQAHRSTASDGSGLGGILFRLSLAGQSLSFYFRQAVAPHNLSPVYDRWAVGGFGWWLPWLAVFALCWWQRATWGRTALLGLGWFGLHLVPVLGLVGISYLRFTWVMDHFLYASLIGLVGLTAAALQLLASRAGQAGKAAAIAFVALAAVVLMHETRAYTPAYASEEALWSYAVRRQPDQWMALGNLGSLRVNQGRLADAVSLLTHAVELNPAAPEAHRNLGVAYNLLGQPNEGIAEARRALALRPDYLLANVDLGTYLAQAGRYAEALPYWEAALRLHPNDADIHNRYGYTLFLMDRRAEGLAQIQRALVLDPQWGPAEFNLGLALAAAGQNAAALPHFEAAARLMPDNAAVQQQVILARKRP